MKLNCRYCDADFEAIEKQDLCNLCAGDEPCAGTVHNEPCKHGNPAVVFNTDTQEAQCLPCREELNQDNQDMSDIEQWALWFVEEANWATPPFK